MKMWNDYEVYPDGTIVSPKGRVLKPSYNKKGYLVVGIKHPDGKWKTTYHHKIIAEAYIGIRPDKHEVDHINGKRDDNRVENLRYLTKSENNQHAYDSGRRDVSGFRNANNKFTKTQLLEVCNLLENMKPVNKSEISRITGVSRMTVSKIFHREQWKELSKPFNF